MASAAPTRYFRVTLLRSAIGLPTKTTGILRALGLATQQTGRPKRMKTVYHKVSPDVAGQIFGVKELVDVQEVGERLSQAELKEMRRPETGFWVEQKASAAI